MILMAGGNMTNRDKLGAFLYGSRSFGGNNSRSNNDMQTQQSLNVTDFLGF